MMDRNSNKLWLYLALAIVSVCGLLVIIIHHQPSIDITVTKKMAGFGNDDIWYALETGASTSEIQRLVDQSGLHVDEIYRLGQSLLYVAVKKKRVDLAVWLLDKGANVNGIYYSDVPLAVAIEKNHIELVKLLLEYGADPAYDMHFGNTPMSKITDKTHNDIIEYLNHVARGSKTLSPNIDEP